MEIRHFEVIEFPQETDYDFIEVVSLEIIILLAKLKALKLGKDSYDDMILNNNNKSCHWQKQRILILGSVRYEIKIRVMIQFLKVAFRSEVQQNLIESGN